MSQQITTARVQQYKAEIMHLSQQKGSRLQAGVRTETQVGKTAFYDRLGEAVAVEKVSRHSDTPQIDSEHSRRRVSLKDYVWADLIDKEDLRRLMDNPSGKYAEAAAWAMGRRKDDTIIAAADGSAYGGEDGSSIIAHPNSQKYAANDGSSLSGLNVRTLRGVKRILDGNDVDESISRHAAINAAGLENLLGETQVTSSDFNTVKALVQGEINTYMGFNFHRLERVLAQVDALSGSATTGAVGSGSSLIGKTRSIFWAMDGMLLATAADIEVRIEDRPDKNYATQVFASMGIGATRLEEEKVVIALT